MSDSNSDTDKDLILNHEYDGIKELDNNLPNWWLAVFFLSIIFGFLYWIHYSLGGGGLSSQDELKVALIEIERMRENNKTAAPNNISISDENSIVTNPKLMSLGKSEFAQKCSSCHGQLGEGSIGPNLTDNYWIHGEGQFADIVKVISNGAPDNGMPPWGSMLSSEKISYLAAYIKSLVGTNPANAKAPQGALVK